MGRATAYQAAWQVHEHRRTFHPGDGPFLHGSLDPVWLGALRRAFPPGAGHFDVGCGEGRMTFALADLWSPGGWSLGADRNETALTRARERAQAQSLGNACFVQADVESGDYRNILADRVPDVVTAHLCMGREIAERAARALKPGGLFAFVCLHPDLWKESGRSSRFALGEDQVEKLLSAFDFEPSFLRFRKETIEFATPEAALSGFFRDGDAVSYWRSDGRWQGVQRHFWEGGRVLTILAQIQCVARKVA